MSAEINDDRTSLLQLPDEVLRIIAAYLDFESLIAFSCTNLRLRDVSRTTLKSVRLTSITNNALKFLDENGALVRSLDLSNCFSESPRIYSLIGKCPRIKRLSAVNSNFGFSSCQFVPVLNVLRCLKELETLRISAPQEWPSQRNHADSFASVKELYINLDIQENSAFSVKLINSCHALEFLHINLCSAFRISANYAQFGRVVEVWETLHTVVCTRHLVPRGYHATRRVHFLLEQIFARISTSEIREWIAQEKLCYIYEHGFVNGEAPHIVGADDNIKLLKHFRSIHLFGDESVAVDRRPPWGPSRSLCVTGSLPSVGIDGGLLTDWRDSLSATLMELDLRELHGTFTEEFRLHLITSTPSLKKLACSICFLARNHSEREALASRGNVEQAPRKLKLEELFVTACHPHKLMCSMDASPFPYESLTAMSDFKYLEVLTIKSIPLDETACSALANLRLRSVRLCPRRAYLSLPGLRSMLRACENLQNLKLEVFNVSLRSEELWSALNVGKKLKKICLKTGVVVSTKLTLSARKHFEIVRRILKSCEILHVHSPHPAYLIELRLHIPIESLKKVIVSSEPFDETPELFGGKLSFKGRALCVAETSIGVVAPIDWDMD